MDVQHFLGGANVDITGKRAIAQSKMSMLQRAYLESIMVDVTCIGRIYDIFESRAGAWKIALRQPICERDRIGSVESCAPMTLDHGLMEQFPVGYRHLADLQTWTGLSVKRDLPGRTGPEVEALCRRGQEWLAIARLEI